MTTEEQKISTARVMVICFISALIRTRGILKFIHWYFSLLCSVSRQSTRFSCVVTQNLKQTGAFSVYIDRSTRLIQAASTGSLTRSQMSVVLHKTSPNLNPKVFHILFHTLEGIRILNCKSSFCLFKYPLSLFNMDFIVLDSKNKYAQ
jgi:hypothetical protein